MKLSPDDVIISEKSVVDLFHDGMRECSELKCYCKKHIPTRWFFGH